MGTAHLTDNERFRVRVLRNDAQFTISRIAQITGYGERQIRNALKSPTVGKRSGRPTALSPAQEAELVRFVTASKENRSMTYADIGKSLFDGAHGEYAIRNTLRRLGFKRSGPVLKQVTREGEKPRGGAAPAAVAGPDRSAGAAEGSPAAASSMEGVSSTEPETTRADDSADDVEMVTENGGLPGGQVRGEGAVNTENQAHGLDSARRHDEGPGEGQVDAQAPGAGQASAEERVSTAVAAAVNGPAPEAVASQALEATQAESTKAADADTATG